MKKLTALLLVLIVGGCAAGRAPDRTSADVPVYAVAGPYPRYDLQIRLHPDERRLEGSGTVVVPPGTEPRPFIGFALDDAMRDFSVEVIEPGSASRSVTLERGQPGEPPWVARLSEPIPAGQPVTLRLSWQGGEEAYIGPEGSFASGINMAWYPVLRGGLGVGDLRVIVPAGLTVHANGLQRGTDEERARGIFHYETTTPSFFAFAAARYFVTRYDGAIPVSVYSLTEREGMQAFVDGSRRAIEVLSREFGPYPSGEFAIVEVPEAEAEAAGFSGASVTGFIMVTRYYVDQPFNLAFYAHEISHQWWGNLIRHRGDTGVWMLDEAMAQYGSLRAVEEIEGPCAAESYRRTGYPGYVADQAGLPYLRIVAAGQDHPLARLPADVNRSIPDGKGFQVWEMLSRMLGRETFSSILRDFTAEHAFQLVTWEEFLTAIETGSGEDLEWFYSQWFERTGAPDYALDWRQEGELMRGRITQAEPYFRARLAIEVRGENGETQVAEVEVYGPETVFALPVSFRAVAAELDPHFQILRWTPEYRAATASADTAAGPSPSH